MANIAEKLTLIAENEQKVYDAGYSKSESDFWDKVQAKGLRVRYPSAFISWESDFFRPKYPLKNSKITHIGNLFQSSALKIAESDYIDFSTCDITKDTTYAKGFYYTFQGCSKLEEVQDIGFIGGMPYYFTFAKCNKLKTVARFVSDEKTTFSLPFQQCYALENLTIDGVIAKSFTINESPLLTHESLMSIIDALKDYSTDTSDTTYTLTIGDTNLAKLTDAEKAIATQKGWSLA